MADPQPQAAPDSVALAGFKGLRNTVTAERLAPEDLERATNIDLDDAGQARRRRGYTPVAAGAYHSLFTAEDGTVYGVKDDAIGIVRPDFSFETLQPGIGSAAVAYVQVGDTVYFSSSTASGAIEDGTVRPWGYPASAREWLSPVEAPTPTLGAVAGKLLSPPPLATALTHLSGRIYLAVGNVVWATELYLYNYVDRTRTHMTFEAPVTGLGAVSDGIYVSTTTAIWFLSGPFGEMRRRKALDAGGVVGSMVSAPVAAPTEKGRPEPKSALLAMTTKGLVLCQDDGAVYNLTEDRVWFPDAVAAAAMYREQDGIRQYVGVLNSAGGPTSTARLGDYVDAEIRRFRGA